MTNAKSDGMFQVSSCWYCLLRCSVIRGQVHCYHATGAAVEKLRYYNCVDVKVRYIRRHFNPFSTALTLRGRSLTNLKHHVFFLSIILMVDIGGCVRKICNPKCATNQTKIRKEVPPRQGVLVLVLKDFYYTERRNRKCGFFFSYGCLSLLIGPLKQCGSGTGR